MRSHRFSLVPLALAAVVLAVPARAETLAEALASAYANNAELNAARAGTRATDERVPQALAGYRPTIDAFVSAGASYINRAGAGGGNAGTLRSAGVGFSIVQPIFRGFRTENSVKAAEAAVRASREQLRNTEQSVLFDAVTAYMDVVQARAILGLRRSNVAFLDEQARAARDRLEVGEGTRTDVAQAEAALASANSGVSQAQANLTAAEGTYRQVIGHEPRKLSAAKPIDRMLPKSLDGAIGASRTEHPAILASIHNADVAGYNVKVIEGELLPSISLEASVNQDWERGFGANTGNSASIVGRLTIPIYEGGQTYSRVREAKESLGQAQIQVDVARDQVHAALVGAWAGLEGARAQVVASRAEISALDLALQGVIEEQRVGQRTTLDVLNAQADIIAARITQVQAERDVVVAGYAILSAMGRLSRDTLGLAAAKYEPQQHYKAVRDKWIGLRTPDGR